QILRDRIVAGPRAGLRGPDIALLQSPTLCERFEPLSQYLRYECAVPHPLRELAILTVARRWKAQYEWFAHAPIAAEAGIPAEAIEAIRTGSKPAFAQADLRAAYECVCALLDMAALGDAEFEAAQRLLGVQGLVDLVALVGHYSTIAQFLNAFRIDLPQGEKAPFGD
ncbi:MAG: carboxymuconolactone decarboxylase family protein, partial [Burkholderiales bacterium]|nr:carboxymuconolactone decarboxylase family protein [Burkholderiales bacterium]